MTLHWDILDEKRQRILPELAKLRAEGFYLAGGTALALIIGHRDSVDFDFFKEESFDTRKLFEALRVTLAAHTLLKTQEEANTLSVVVDDTVRLSFFLYPYPMLEQPIETPHFPIASVIDIACMKLSAITSRSTFKDYVDIYFILKERPLAELVDAAKKKMPTLDSLLILKSLVYFDDIVAEDISFKTSPVSLDEIRKDLTGKVAAYSLKQM